MDTDETQIQNGNFYSTPEGEGMEFWQWSRLPTHFKPGEGRGVDRHISFLTEDNRANRGRGMNGKGMGFISLLVRDREPYYRRFLYQTGSSVASPYLMTPPQCEMR
jgi:hypothetical protein